MSGKHIELPFGVVGEKTKKIKLKLPPNFKNDVLFDQLTYLPHLENPAIVDAVKNNIVDGLSLQKYLLAAGLLKDSIQDSLDMVVSEEGKLSNAAVTRQLDKKFLSVMRKLFPSDAALKDKGKFDTQNPIIGTLLTQIEWGKLNNEKQIKKTIRS